jgi:hypothetical protein
LRFTNVATLISCIDRQIPLIVVSFTTLTISYTVYSCSVCLKRKVTWSLHWHIKVSRFLRPHELLYLLYSAFILCMYIRALVLFPGQSILPNAIQICSSNVLAGSSLPIPYPISKICAVLRVTIENKILFSISIKSTHNMAEVCNTFG